MPGRRGDAARAAPTWHASPSIALLLVWCAPFPAPPPPHAAFPPLEKGGSREGVGEGVGAGPAGRVAHARARPCCPPPPFTRIPFPPFVRKGARGRRASGGGSLPLLAPSRPLPPFPRSGRGFEGRVPGKRGTDPVGRCAPTHPTPPLPLFEGCGRGRGGDDRARSYVDPMSHGRCGRVGYLDVVLFSSSVTFGPGARVAAQGRVLRP